MLSVCFRYLKRATDVIQFGWVKILNKFNTLNFIVVLLGDFVCRFFANVSGVFLCLIADEFLVKATLIKHRYVLRVTLGTLRHQSALRIDVGTLTLSQSMFSRVGTMASFDMYESHPELL